MLDGDVDAAGLGADGAHRLAVADELEQALGIVGLRLAQEEAFSLDLRISAHGPEPNRYGRGP